LFIAEFNNGVVVKWSFAHFDITLPGILFDTVKVITFGFIFTIVINIYKKKVVQLVIVHFNLYRLTNNYTPLSEKII
jgi:hypothetical protein